MKLSRLLILALSISIAILACREDEMGFIPSGNTETMSTVNLTGFVTDPDGNPVMGATVQYDTEDAVTDDTGYYILENVEASSKHASLVVTKSGFFSGSRTFRTSDSGTVFHRVTLIPLGNALNFTGGNGSVATNLVNIDFPENSVKDELTGELYNGEVEIFIKHIGTDEFAMPGDLTSINQNDELEILHSYGMVFVEMFADDGRKLNVADGQAVSMTYEIPEELLATAPETIKMWWFDYDAGVWREEGEARREGSRWVGSVAHFSCWNFDLNVPSVLVNGQIIQSNGGQSQFYVTILNDNDQGGRGSANADGSFSGRVEAGVQLELTIEYIESNCDTIVYQEMVGPFNQDTDLGDITVNLDGLPSKPSAAFIINKDDDLEKTYIFTNTSSVSGIEDTSFTTFWDFGGDGTSTEDSPTHTFSNEGLYNVTLTITATDGEVSTTTRTINVGGDSNKFASITDSRDDDTGELRLETVDAILNGKISFIYRVSAGQEMDIADGFFAVGGNSTSGDLIISEIRIKDNAPHEFREGASDNTIIAGNFPMGVADVWVPIELSWDADGVSVPTYSLTIGGQIVIIDAISTTNGGVGDVEDHLAAVMGGAMNFQWKYNSNSATSDGRYDIDNIKLYSSDSGTEIIIFEDDFEGRQNGEDLDSDYNFNSPYHQNSNDASVGEDF